MPIQFDLPPFPKTHFWQKTNNNPQMIEKRRSGLENFLSHVINDPYLRGYPQVKRIIKMCKKGSICKRRLSDLKTEDSSGAPRSYSFDKASSYSGNVLSKDDWLKIKRMSTIRR